MTEDKNKKASILGNLTFQIVFAMLLGAVLGVFIHNNYSLEDATKFSGYIKMLATIFIRLVQMIISPLVFTTLVVGIAKLGDIKAVGRIGGKALGWFFTASFVSLLIGMFFVNVLAPGEGLNLSNVDASAVSELTEKTHGFSAQNFIEHIIPKSIVEAMATNEILRSIFRRNFFSLGSFNSGRLYVSEKQNDSIIKKNR